MAEAAAAGITRWELSHVAAARASGAVAVAFVPVRGHLRERGDGPASAVGLGLVLFGSTLFAMLPVPVDLRCPMILAMRLPASRTDD